MSINKVIDSVEPLSLRKKGSYQGFPNGDKLPSIWGESEFYEMDFCTGGRELEEE